MTVLNVMGCGSQKGFTDEYTGVRTNVNLLPKLQIEVIVNDEDVDQIVDRICEETVTGHSGDGKIIVKDVCDVIRVRTKEHGKDAVYEAFGGTDSPYIWMQTPHGMGSWEFFDYLLSHARVCQVFCVSFEKNILGRETSPLLYQDTFES